MGAGVSQKTMNGYYYRRLKKLQRELEVAGVPSVYGRWHLGGNGWGVYFNTLRASNGETCGMMHVCIDAPLERYGKNWDAEKGIARIKELFGRAA
jgi:hypothetical protein